MEATLQITQQQIQLFHDRRGVIDLTDVEGAETSVGINIDDVEDIAQADFVHAFIAYKNVSRPGSAYLYNCMSAILILSNVLLC